MRRISCRALALAPLLAALLVPAGAADARRPRTNLRESYVRTSATSVQPGGSFTASDKVRNTSRRRSPRSRVGFYLSRDRRSADGAELLASRRVKRLRRHRSSRASTRIVVPGSFAPGRYTLIACADYLARVRERSERDNCAATARTIEVVEPPATLLAAGDVGDCSQPFAAETAELLETRPGTVALLGDGAYPHGSSADYFGCYEDTWGRVGPRTRPVPGDHDYDTAGAAGYFGYFGSAAGDRGRGWYSYEVGPWHVIALNSACSQVGGCGPGSDQIRFLQSDLAAHPAACTLAYWHNPKYSSGAKGGSSRMDTAWSVLANAGAELVLNGDDHDYERLAPLDAAGRVDRARGMRELVVGTGGATLHPFQGSLPSTEARQASAHGILQLTLRPGGYDWSFVSVPGQPYGDSGSGSCH